MEKGGELGAALPPATLTCRHTASVMRTRAQSNSWKEEGNNVCHARWMLMLMWRKKKKKKKAKAATSSSDKKKQVDPFQQIMFSSK